MMRDSGLFFAVEVGRRSDEEKNTGHPLALFLRCSASLFSNLNCLTEHRSSFPCRKLEIRFASDVRRRRLDGVLALVLNAVSL